MDNESKDDIAGSGTGLTEQSLRGEVVKVLFESADGAYSVLRILDAQGIEHTVKGPITGAFQGQGVEVSGVWENHKEHGRQLKVSSYKFVLPATPEGIKRYLCSGVLPGIGPKLAGCIVDTFGVKTLEILDRFSARLREVSGLGKKRIEQIRKAWQENVERRSADIFLQGLGISQAYCNRIHKFYGADAAEIIKANPYRMADDVNGIGFLMADRAAASLGIGKNDEKRLRAGILYTLNQLRGAGHTCYPADELLRCAAETLDIEPSDALRGLHSAVDTKDAVIVPRPQQPDMIYLGELFSAESELPGLLFRINSMRNHAGAKMQKVPPRNDLNLSEEQLLTVKRAADNPISIITGGPGVGKTTVIGEIVRRALACRLKVFLAAPTGRAAKRLSETSGITAMTIHRMLKWEPVEKKFIFNINNRLSCDLLIVDEISMLDITLALHLFRAVKPGTTVVLVGDADQLPSVGPGRVLNDFIDSGVFTTTCLRKIFRQGAGSRIVINAHAVNEGFIPEVPVTSKDELTDFYWIEQDEPEKVSELIMKLVSRRIPSRFGFDPMKDIQVLSPMNRGICGTYALNEMLREAVNPGSKPQFKSRPACLREHRAPAGTGS